MHISHLTDWSNFLTVGNWLSVWGCLFAGLVHMEGVDCERNRRATQGYDRCPSAKPRCLSEQLFLLFSQEKL